MEVYQTTSLGLLVHLVLILVFSIRVILKKFPVGATLSWLLMLNLLPYVGIVLYLLFGERYLGMRYQKREKKLIKATQLHLDISAGLHHQQWQGFHPMSSQIATYELNSTGLAALAGNKVRFFNQASDTIQAMIKDIEAATDYCHLEFYIWHPGGLTLQVLQALISARQRGVKCKVLLDAVGSRQFFLTGYPTRLRQEGIDIVRASPIGITPWRLARYDLRYHRKCLVVDGKVAYMGSFNLIDPASFKQDQGVGQWIDVMARVTGPTVVTIDNIFRWYWNIESGQNLALTAQTGTAANQGTVLQVVPSGPDNEKESILHSLLQGIFSATKSIRLVTPYFVPDPSLAQALLIAARRNVKVEIIVPETVDSFLVQYASRSYYQDLLNAGVSIYQFQNGLLHTKCIILDGKVSFFGTVNIDARSLWLNFEMTMIIYSSEATQQLDQLFDDYLQSSQALSAQVWRERPLGAKLLENLVHLFSPLI